MISGGRPAPVTVTVTVLDVTWPSLSFTATVAVYSPAVRRCAGYLVALFALVWIANIYMSLYGFVRVGMKKEGVEAKIKEVELKKERQDTGDTGRLQ